MILQMEEMKHPEEENLQFKRWCWSQLSVSESMPCPRSLHTGVVLDNSFYVFGGYDGIQRTNDFFAFNFSTKKWCEVPPCGSVPSSRDRHVSVCYKHSIYIYGGYDGFNRVNDFFEFNTSSQSWSQVQSATGPSARHSHAAVVYKDSMYVFGGYDGVYKNDFHEFSFTDMTWSNLNDLAGNADDWPKPRYRTSMAVIADKMFLFGGHDGSRQLNDFYTWDFSQCQWTKIVSSGTIPTPRDSHVAVTYKNSFFLFGGSTGNARSDFYEYKPEENMWTVVNSSGGTPPCSRFCHVGVVHHKCFYVFGGYDGVQRLNDFNQFRLDDEAEEIPESTIIGDLESYINSPDLSDIVFMVEGKPVYAHKLMVCRSRYFQSMFCGTLKEKTASEVTLHEVSYDVFLSIMKYLYTDKASITLENAMEVLRAADMFCIDRLKAICERMVLQSMGVNNAAQILQTSEMHGSNALKESSMKFIIANFDQVSKTEAFHDMARANVELVIEILKNRNVSSY